jgi:hypothetical protein
MPLCFLVMAGSGALEGRMAGGSGPVAGRVVGIGGATLLVRVIGEARGAVCGRVAMGGKAPERGTPGSGPVEARLGMIGREPEPRRGGTGAFTAMRPTAGAGGPPAGGGLGTVFFLTSLENLS